MKTMKLMINGNLETVQVERYFRTLNNQYLIYSKDGADIDGNVRINVVKIENDQVVPIEEATEWETVKNTIVEIVNDNRELTKLSIEDLDYQHLDGLNVTAVQALRLPSAVMPYLSANQPDFNSLEIKEKQLDAKVEALKDMNQDLATMMDEVGKEFSVATNQPEEATVEEKMGATMEIIMPSKQLVAEAKEASPSPQKEKSHFNLKNLFGKKKNKEKEIEEEKVEVKEEKISTEPEKEVQEPKVEESISELPVVEESIPIESITPSEIEIATTTESTPIEENVSVEEPIKSETDAGFDFFGQNQDVIIPGPIATEPINTMPVEIPDIPPVEVEEPMEILELEEEKYKEMYEEEQKKVALLESQVQALNGNIKRLEETLTQYQERFNKIKSIVD